MKIIGAAAKVAETLLQSGPASVSDLARTLSLTPAAVRKHLDVLEAAELVSSHERAPYGPTGSLDRGKGRPAKFFALTERGREQFHPQPPDLALAALEFIEAKQGRSAVRQFVEETLPVNGDTLPEIVAELEARGYCPSVQPAPLGTQLSLRNCPYSHLAGSYREFCEVETSRLAEALGVNVTQISTIAAGADICTVHISATSPRRTA